MQTSSLLSTLFLALLVSANPIVVNDNPVRISFSKKINVTSPAHIVKQDRARAALLRTNGMAKASGINPLQNDDAAGFGISNQAVSYVANVNIGSPATSYSLLIDTGSSNTWVGAGKPFTPTSTTVQTNTSVAVQYGSGSFSGSEVTDTVSFGSGLTITAQSIGVASTSEGFSGVDGILGIGPVDLTLDTLGSNPNTNIPTVTDNLFGQSVIPAHEVAVSFEPASSGEELNGELTFGGTDSSKFTGQITFTPITSTPPASEFWGINQSIRFGSTNILSETAGIVDTGTTLVLLASDAFSTYQEATGGVLDESTGLLKLTADQFNNLQSLFFNIGNVDFELTANAQAWPRALNADIGGDPDSVYLIVNDIGTPSGEGLDFINGFAFLERFYSVFDTAGQQVGFANTALTQATTN